MKKLNSRELNSITGAKKTNLGNWVRLELPAEAGIFALAPPEQLDHIPIRENLWYIKSGGEGLGKKRGDGDAWVVFEPQNMVEVIWFNRHGGCMEPPEDICSDIADYYCESTGFQDMVPLSDLNPSLPDLQSPPADGMQGVMGLGELGIPQQQTIPMPPPPYHQGMDYYAAPPPPPPPTPMGYGYRGPPPNMRGVMGLGQDQQQEEESFGWKVAKILAIGLLGAAGGAALLTKH